MHRSGWKLLRTAAKVCGIAALAIVAMLIVIVPIARWFLFGGDRFTGTTFTPEAWAAAGSCIERADLKKCEEEWGW
jgi:hypothetical protein